ncbi:MAG: 4Fe-4S binding protein [Eubacteriales bacterium]|nr:4Fe-4S binding protein [Eubacteriales bacterium]
MKRRIIAINQEKCDGCGLCVNACHEGAIGLIDGKAVLLRDDYCDGLGDCLPNCPTGAITFIEKETVPYDAEAVKKHMEERGKQQTAGGGCPGARMHSMKAERQVVAGEAPSQLTMWPVQIKLAAPNAPYFNGCDLLIAADCTAYAYGNFHTDFIRDHVTIIGCPKLDNIDYSVKLAAILQYNDIKSITVARMEVPCCGGLTAMVQKAVQASGKDIPVRIQVISIDGKLL